MKVRETHILENVGRAFAVIDGNHGTYITSIDINTGQKYCSCIGFGVWKKCKHIKMLEGIVNLWRWKNMAVSFGKKKTIFRKFKSSLDCINEMFGGKAYSSGEIFAVYSPPGYGKTLYAIQETIWLISQGYNVLYIETEGSGEEMLDEWAPILAARFNADLDKLYFESRRTLESLAQYLGFEIRFVTKQVDEDEVAGSVNQLTLADELESDGGKKKKRKKKKKKDKGAKLEVVYAPLDFALIEKEIEKYKIDFVILDSLSMPIRAAFPPDQQNNPSKSFIEARILQKFIELQEKYNVGVLVVLHASMNPVRPYETQIKFRGGLSVGHAVKRVVYLGKRDAKEYEDYRKFWLIRAANAKPWSKFAVAKITDMGYIDVPISEWANAFTTSELKRVNEVLEQMKNEKSDDDA